MLSRLLSHRWVQVALLLSLLGGAVALRLQDPPAIERLRHLTFDAYNKAMPRLAHDDTLIVDIDEASIRAIGQWPWPRTKMAALTDKLAAMGAKAIVFDVVFAETDRTSPPVMAAQLPADAKTVADGLASLPDHDALFAQSIASAGNVVMGFVGANQVTGRDPLLIARMLNTGQQPAVGRFVRGLHNFTTSLPQLTEAAAGNGSFTPLVENDGIVRRLPLLIGLEKNNDGVAEAVYPALSLEAVRVALGKKVLTVTSHGVDNPAGLGVQSIAVGDRRVPTDETGGVWVYYTGHRPELYVPALSIIDGSIDASRVKDKIVFVGTSAIGLLDLRATPFKTDTPGVEIHAEMVEQILHGQFLQRPSFLIGAEMIATLAVSLAIIFLAPFISTLSMALLAVVVIGGGTVLSIYAYGHMGLLVDGVYPALVTLTIFILSAVLTSLRSETEKKAVRQAFSHYISPVLMDELTRNPDKLRLGGEVRELTVMFTDIRNFTTISEGLDPAELIRMMNDFLTPMTSCVLESRGTIDKYMGDAIMAFWNAPLTDAEHARNAARAALQMVAALEPVNAELEARAQAASRTHHPLRAGIGLHTGPASVGNMGSRQRFAYSALGDTVNLTSRLEGQTKNYGVSILASEATMKAAADFAWLEADLIKVKGRQQPVRIFMLAGDAETNKNADFNSLQGKHNKMLGCYRAQEWQEAAQLTQELEKALPAFAAYYAMILSRIEQYKNTPPANDWQGVWIAADK